MAASLLILSAAEGDISEAFAWYVAHEHCSQRSSPAHRFVRPPQRRQVVAAERDDAARSVDCFPTSPAPRPIRSKKPMELLPLGPVLFIDTAGIDDEGALGEKRVQKTRQVFEPHRYRRSGRRRRAMGQVRGRHLARIAGSRHSRHRGLQQIRRFQAVGGIARPTPRNQDAIRRNRRVRGARRSRTARGIAASGSRGLCTHAGDCGRLGSAGRDRRAGRAHRPRSAQRPADRATGADDPRFA